MKRLGGAALELMCWKLPERSGASRIRSQPCNSNEKVTGRGHLYDVNSGYVGRGGRGPATFAGATTEIIRRIFFDPLGPELIRALYLRNEAFPRVADVA
jgi:hypothetical protein